MKNIERDGGSHSELNFIGSKKISKTPLWSSYTLCPRKTRQRHTISPYLPRFRFTHWTINLYIAIAVAPAMLKLGNFSLSSLFQLSNAHPHPCSKRVSNSAFRPSCTPLKKGLQGWIWGWTSERIERRYRVMTITCYTWLEKWVGQSHHSFKDELNEQCLSSVQCHHFKRRPGSQSNAFPPD